MTYYKELKIQRAIELLKKPENTVSEVAETLSFSSPYHFSNAFKNATGMSPTAFRNKHKITYPGGFDI